MSLYATTRLDIAHEQAHAELLTCARRFDQLVARPRLKKRQALIRDAAAQLRLVARMLQNGTYDLDIADAWAWAANNILNNYQKALNR